MKKLQYLVSLILLISLGDESLAYSHSVQLVVFLVSAYIFTEEIESRRSMYFYLLLVSMILFNPFYSPWFAIEPVRVTSYVLISMGYLLKTSDASLILNHRKKEFKGAY